MPDPSHQQEIIRVEDNGTPVYAEWDESQQIPVAVDGAVRARQENKGRINAKTEQIKARLAELSAAAQLAEQLDSLTASSLLSGVDRWYSAPEVARLFFNRSPAWIYDRLSQKKFRYPNGEEITPHFDDPDSKRPRARFDLELVKEIALSCYRSGTVKYEELELIMSRVARAKIGEVIFEDQES